MTHVKRNTRDEAEAAAPTLMVIGGGARESVNGTFIDVENPANHTVVCRVPRAGPSWTPTSTTRRIRNCSRDATRAWRVSLSPLLGSQGQDWLHA